MEVQGMSRQSEEVVSGEIVRPEPTAWVARHQDGSKTTTMRKGTAEAFEYSGHKIAPLYELPEGCVIVRVRP